MSAPVIIVHLRRPRSADKRTDPLYEFGSFGLTGCHRRNLLADTSAAGARLAFAQGGDLGFRLVMLTPPIDVRQLAHVQEAFWSPASMPLRYDSAPVIIDNDGSSDVDGMRELLDGVNRTTWREKFSSAFRTRKSPLEFRVATGIVRAWDQAIEDGTSHAVSYWEALPYWDPDVVDQDRHSTHQSLLMNARGEAPTIEDDDDESLTEDDDATAEILRVKCGATKGAVKPKRPSGGTIAARAALATTSHTWPASSSTYVVIAREPASSSRTSTRRARPIVDVRFRRRVSVVIQSHARERADLVDHASIGPCVAAAEGLLSCEPRPSNRRAVTRRS